MPPKEGEFLAKHSVSPGHIPELKARIEGRKQEIIARYDNGKGKLLAKDKRPEAKNGSISEIEKELLGQGQFIFLYLVVMPDLPIEEDHYGFAFELEKLKPLDPFYREKDLIPKFAEVWFDVFKVLYPGKFNSKNYDRKKLEKFRNKALAHQSKDIPLSEVLDLGKLPTYKENPPDCEKPEILVRGELDVSLASWFIIGGKYLNRDEFESWLKK